MLSADFGRTARLLRHRLAAYQRIVAGNGPRRSKQLDARAQRSMPYWQRMTSNRYQARCRQVMCTIAMACAFGALEGANSALAAADGPVATVSAGTGTGQVVADTPSARLAEARALAQDEGSTVGAAVRKLEWQRRAADFISRARELSPEEFGGAWLEGDTVRAWVKDDRKAKAKDELKSLAAGHSLGTLDARTASWSEASLIALQAQIDESLALVNRGVLSTVDIEPDVKQNRLVLRVPPAPTASQQELVRKVLAAYPDVVERGSKSAGKILRACSGPWCDPPLRGGIGLVIGSTHGCTAGFVVQSASNSTRYLTTQKHCFDSGGYGTYRTAFADSSNHNIGSPVGWDSSDRGLLGINNQAGWSPGPYIRTHGAPQYAITGAVIPAVGTRTCLSGSRTWAQNHCGQVTYGLATRNGYTNTLRAQLATCPVPGDSGGPYFSYGIAHGTDIGEYGNTGCGGSLFSSLNNLLSMNVRMLVQG